MSSLLADGGEARGSPAVQRDHGLAPRPIGRAKVRLPPGHIFVGNDSRLLEEGSIMQKSYFLPYNVNLLIHRPACPKCRAHMILARIMPARVGFDIRTFECPKCDLLKEMMVETDAFGQSFTPTA
jgi:hypothetical protein